MLHVQLTAQRALPADTGRRAKGQRASACHAAALGRQRRNAGRAGRVLQRVHAGPWTSLVRALQLSCSLFYCHYYFIALLLYCYIIYIFLYFTIYIATIFITSLYFFVAVLLWISSFSAAGACAYADRVSTPSLCHMLLISLELGMIPNSLRSWRHIACTLDRECVLALWAASLQVRWMDEPIHDAQPNNPHPSLINADFAPVPQAKRTFTTWDLAALWIGLVVCVPSYTLVSSLIELGFSWWQARTPSVAGADPVRGRRGPRPGGATATTPPSHHTKP